MLGCSSPVLSPLGHRSPGVWPWVVQNGCLVRRVYSYVDAIGLGIHSSDRILP